MNRLLPLTIMLLMIGPVSAQSERVTLTGTWNETIVEIEDAYLSNVPITLDVKALGRPGRSWKLEVERTQVDWHPDLVLEVSLDSGKTYQEIDAAPVLLAEGLSHEDGIVELTYRLTGVSTAVSAGSYSTAVTYTVTFVD